MKILFCLGLAALLLTAGTPAYAAETGMPDPNYAYDQDYVPAQPDLGEILDASYDKLEIEDMVWQGAGFLDGDGEYFPLPPFDEDKEKSPFILTIGSRGKGRIQDENGNVSEFLWQYGNSLFTTIQSPAGEKLGTIMMKSEYTDIGSADGQPRKQFLRRWLTLTLSGRKIFLYKLADLKCYDDLANHFADVANSAGDRDYGGENGVREAAKALGGETLYKLGYAVTDLSGDGVPEFIVAAHSGVGGQILAVYTMESGLPCFVFEGGWEQDCYWYTGDGRFAFRGEKSWGVCVLSRDGKKLQWERFFFTEPDPSDPNQSVVYANETGVCDPARSQRLTDSSEWQYEVAEEDLPLRHFFSDAG